MKKVDLHIHTVPTISDAHFIFSLDAFQRYAEESELDAVAVTNHDTFDQQQFERISRTLTATVFPGIEINLAKGHLLLIGCPSQLEDFARKASIVAQKIQSATDYLSVSDLKDIYEELDRYLLIPHYEKKPPLRGDALRDLLPHISAGEVDSAKKFVRAIKDDSKPTPVIFSDSRMKENLSRLPIRQTFIDCGELSIEAIKECLQDKAKVALSANDGNRLWQTLESGQHLSTGLNVLVGARSSGKTHTLNEISRTVENSKYIKQFSLVQQNETEYARSFESEVEKRRSIVVDSFLAGLKRTTDSIIEVDLLSREREIERYIETLLKSAEETDRHDAFSKAVLFSEEPFPLGNNETLESLIASVKQIIENVEFKEIIERHVDRSSLKALILELIETLRDRASENKKKQIVNDIIGDAKQGLRVRTSATQVDDIDLYGYALDQKRVDRFRDMVNLLKKERVIHEQNLQGFRIEARRSAFAGAGEIKEVSRRKTAFSEAFREYDDPYQYLQALLEKDDLPRGELYKYFIKVSYRILNEDGFQVSGGERSEFRLLQEIADAQNYDILLIDEPESSFDNLFLKSDVNQILKAISETMPVVVVTHNSTVGASVGADYVLFSKKSVEDGKVVYRLYSGHPTDKTFSSVDGATIESHEVMMDSLEAGLSTYDRRRQSYEAIKN
ncbi:MAG: phosphotransferase [Thiohalocapsa sp. PB-PSB1]|nr:MAG: phosphotransferase [Thiohalocapsa sp. PB-PSB1]